MKGPPTQRKVLIIEDEPSIRNALFVLLAGLGCEGDVAYTGQQALAMISREKFDAVLLDLRCSNAPAEEVVSQITELRPNLVGRVLVITGEVTDEQTMDLLSRHLLPSVPRNRLMPELWGQLRGILDINHKPKTVES
ncbi:MAG: response regulator [Terriglobia bacterium]